MRISPAPPGGSAEEFRVPVEGRVYAVELAEHAWCSDLLVYGTATAVGVIRLTLPEDSESGGLQHQTLHVFHHDSRVRRLAWSPDTNLAEVPCAIKFASAGADHVLRVYRHTGRGENGKLEIQTLCGHTDYINGVCFTSEGRGLASVGDDLTIRLWDAENYTQIACIPTRTPCVAVRWHADEPSQLLAASADGTLTFFNTETLTAISALHTGITGLADVDWSPADSLKVAALHESALVTMDVSKLSRREWEAEAHPGGVGQQVRFCRSAPKLIATCSLNQVRVAQTGLSQAPLVADFAIVGGISWHSVLPYLVAGGDRKLTVWRVSVL